MIIARPNRMPRTRKIIATILSGFVIKTPTERHNNAMTRQIMAIAACRSDFRWINGDGEEDLLIIRQSSFRAVRETTVLLSMTISYVHYFFQRRLWRREGSHEMGIFHTLLRVVRL
jgi:hypothetical protein